MGLALVTFISAPLVERNPGPWVSLANACWFGTNRPRFKSWRAHHFRCLRAKQTSVNFCLEYPSEKQHSTSKENQDSMCYYHIGEPSNQADVFPPPFNDRRLDGCVGHVSLPPTHSMVNAAVLLTWECFEFASAPDVKRGRPFGDRLTSGPSRIGPLCLLRLCLHLLRFLLQAFPVHRCRSHVVMHTTEFLEVPRVGIERLGKSSLLDLILTDDMMPIGRGVPASGDFAPTGLLRHSCHDSPKGDGGFNMVAYLELLG